MQVHGEAAVLDREMLAWWVDGRRPDKLGPLLDELISIGFLVIYDGGVDKNGRRRKRRDQDGRALPDVYAVRSEAPDTYKGPLNLTQARAYFQVDRDAAYATYSSSGRRARPGQVRVDRQIKGHLTESEFSQVNPGPSQPGPEKEPGPLQKGPGEFSQVNPGPSQPGPYIGDPSGISEGGIPEGGSAASPAVAGADAAAPTNDQVDWARQLVRELPWRDRGRGPTSEEAAQIAAGFRRAIDTYGFTEDEVRDHALTKLSEADPKKNPIAYVEGAFARERLDRVRPAGSYEPLSDSPLSLPGQEPATSSSVPEQSTTQQIPIVPQDNAEPEVEKPQPSADHTVHVEAMRRQLAQRRQSSARKRSA